jgi:hypothetical protein
MRISPLLVAFGAFVLGGVLSAAVSDLRPPNIYVVDFMKVAPGQDEAYLQVEQAWWKPVHAERIRRGQMRAWALYRVRYPDGAERDYDFVTVNVFANFEDAERDPFELFPVVHPKLDVQLVEQETSASRRLVRGELWYQVDHL